MARLRLAILLPRNSVNHISEDSAARGTRAAEHCRENHEGRLRRAIPLHGFIPGLTETRPSS